MNKSDIYIKGRVSFFQVAFYPQNLDWQLICEILCNHTQWSFHKQLKAKSTCSAYKKSALMFRFVVL